MPDTPIDQSNAIASVRLKVPTGTVPIPPDGYVQLHAPDVDGLALRQSDGSVTPVGGGGGGLVDGELQFNGHAIVFHDVEGRHEITIYPEPGSNIKLAGPVTNQANQPFLPAERRTTTLTSGQLLALHTTPVELWTSPAGGRFVAPSGLALKYLFDTTPYTSGGFPDLEIAYDVGGTLVNIVSLSSNVLVDQTANRQNTASTDVYVSTHDFSGARLVLYNAGDPLTAGDGSLVVSVVAAEL